MKVEEHKAVWGANVVINLICTRAAARLFGMFCGNKGVESAQKGLRTQGVLFLVCFVGFQIVVDLSSGWDSRGIP